MLLVTFCCLDNFLLEAWPLISNPKPWLFWETGKHRIWLFVEKARESALPEDILPTNWHDQEAGMEPCSCPGCWGSRAGRSQHQCGCKWLTCRDTCPWLFPCYWVQAHSARRLPGQWLNNEVLRQGIQPFGKPADQEDGRLMSQNDHLMGSKMPGSFKNQRWRDVRKQKGH